MSVYPEGAVNDTVDEAIPKDIKKDFQEALRCMGVNAFKATVAMCGRAIQASAIQLGASGKDLVNQIDDMAAKGIITNPLKEMAHDIRITRNVGVHPDKDGLKDVEEKDAKDIISFTREFFHHVYVMPALREARRNPPPNDQS